MKTPEFNNHILLCLSAFFLICYFICSKQIEGFYFGRNVWNIPTRWPRSVWDIRGYNNYVFLHKGSIYNPTYLNLAKHPELGYYLPYYHNGMIYTADGKYTYDQFSNMFPSVPIVYGVSYDNIDWMGLINNGIIIT